MQRPYKRQRSERRGQGVGSHIGTVVHRHHPSIFRGVDGVSPALGGPPGKGSRRNMVYVSMCVAHGERERKLKLVISLPWLNTPFHVHMVLGVCKHISLSARVRGKGPSEFNFLSHFYWIQKSPARMLFMGNGGNASQQGTPQPGQGAIHRCCCCDVSWPGNLEIGRPSF